MPIGSTYVYNPGDLILSTVSASGTSFVETKIAAATSSLILFNSSATLTSQSLNSVLIGSSSYVSGSTGIITNLTASNISASGKIQANQLTASSILANNGPLMVTGSNAYIQMFPVGGFSLPTSLSASYIYTSGSTNDLYFTQYNGPYTNTTRLRWLESNLYTGLLHGGVLTSTPGSTTFTVTEGEGLIVSLNAFTASAPYPTVKLISWPTSTQPITYSGSAKITYVGINDVGGIVQQTNAWGSSDINQWDNQIELGVVLHLSGSVSTGVFNSPQISYGIPQQTDDFLRAFGPLKVSGHTLQASGSSPTLSIKKSGGTAYREGANYVNNPNHPSTVVENAINTSKIYRYYLSGSTPIIDTGVANAGYSTIDNNNYVDTATGQLATVGNSNWTIQRVFWVPNSPTNAFIVYYGNATYSTLLNAVNAKDSEPFAESPNTALNAIFVGYIIIEGGAGRDLLNAAECTIIQGGLFRNVGGVGSSGTTPVSTTLAGLSDVALSGLAAGDLLVYGGGQWNNNKTLDGNYTITGSLTIQSGITGNLTGTSSWASNARTASYVVNSISSSYVSGSTGVLTNIIANTISASVISASLFLGTASFATTAQTANALNTANSYTISGLTNNGTLSQQGTLSMGSGYQLLLTTGTAPVPSLSFIGDTNTGLYSPGADTIGFSISGSERVTISNSGSVGIGTTSPNQRLEVNTGTVTNGLGARIGEARIGSWISDGNYAVFSHNTVADTTNSYCLLHRSTGEVYLNAAASQVIHFRSNNVDTWAIYSTGVLESNGAQTIQTSTGNLKLATAAGDGHILLTPNGSGNVGIGTTLPIAIVDVQGTNVTIYAANYVGSLGTMYLRGNDAYNSGTAGAGIYLRGKYDSSSNVTTFGAISAIKENDIDGNYAGALTFLSRTNGQGSGAAEKMRIDSNGNVGIGTTSPGARLEISGSSNSALFNIKSPISGNIIFVTGSGCVGINKSTPTATFDISGSTIITGSLNVSTNITCLSLTETSTEAVKYNIVPLPSQLDNVLKLTPVSFNYKKNDKHSIGLIAEEVAKIYPEFTSDNNDSISYGKITSVLIQSIKELKDIIDAQQKQIENLVNKLK